MDNGFYKPSYLYQYTTIGSLALILKTRSIKFNSLAYVDDLEEMKSGDIDEIGRYVFASCWTDKKEENIALWNMYAEKMRGIRIGLPVYSLEDSKDFVQKQVNKYKLNLIEYGSETITLPDNTYVWKDFKWANYYQLREIVYTDDDRKLFPNIIRTDDEGNIRLDSLRLGLCKRKCWEFQQEWRYLIYIGLNSNNKIDTLYRVNKKKKVPDSLFARIDAKQFEKMTVLMGPGTNESDYVIVDALKEKFNPTMTIEKSYFSEKISV